MKFTRLLAITLPVCLLGAGCLETLNHGAPTKFEDTFYEVKTNYVTEVITKTNTIWEKQVQVVPITNEVGVVVNYTNFFNVPQYETVTITNSKPEYDWQVRDSAKEDAQAIGGVINMFALGIGSAVSGALVGFLKLWGKLRTTKQAGITLANNIEAIREFIKTLPDGAKIDTAVVSFMQRSQNKANALTEITRILAKNVNDKDAKVASEEIQNAIAALSK